MRKEVLENVTILIPSLNPNFRLLEYVNSLVEIGFEHIIVVNDGSDKKYDNIFWEINEKRSCEVIKHAVNQGKGRALKTGFHHYLNNFDKNYGIDFKIKGGVVTADADGQHSPEDTYKVAEALYEQNDKFILGTRDFNEEQVPFKSRYGNKITTLIFTLLYGKKINDTQTGLRGIPFNQIAQIINLNGEKFDYEIHMLIYAIRSKISIQEVTIETIYIDDNRETHFDSVKDSIKIYKIIFKQFFTFIISSLLSSIIDICIFYVFLNFFFAGYSISEKILFSTVIARIISSLFNYFANHNFVFESTENHKATLMKYYILCAIQMIFSASLVLLVELVISGNPTVIKVFVDLFLFFISYRIQNKIIFKRDEAWVLFLLFCLYWCQVVCIV